MPWIFSILFPSHWLKTPYSAHGACKMVSAAGQKDAAANGENLKQRAVGSTMV
jgi:hypothetical protein